MITIDGLRTLFNGAALMAATGGFTTNLVLAHAHEKPFIVAFPLAAMSIALVAVGLCEMASHGKEIRKLGGSILGNDQPK